MKKTYIKTNIELINKNAVYINLNEVGKLFSPPISYTTLWKWQKEGVIKLIPRVFGNKKFYHIDEVIQELERHKETSNHK